MKKLPRRYGKRKKSDTLKMTIRKVGIDYGKSSINYENDECKE